MLEIISLAVISLFVFLLVARITKRRGRRGAARREESVLDAWSSAEAARIIAKRLVIEENELASTLSGNPDPDLVTQLEKAVRKVEIVYERVPGGGDAADMRVEVSFEDGHVERSVRRVAYAELPEAVKNDFASTGTAHVFRPWAFPWQR